MRAARAWERAGIVAIAAAGCREARAEEHARATLTFNRVDRAESACPDEATMRGLVAARIGYDPFVDGADTAIKIEIRPDGSEFVARVTRTSKESDKKGERSLSSTGGDCYELASSTSLAVALAVDPEAARRPIPPNTPPVSPPAPAPTPPPAPPAPAVPPAGAPHPQVEAPKPPPRRGPRIGVRVNGDVVVGAGVVPGVSVGPRLGVGVDGEIWSLSAEADAIVSGSESTPYGSVSASVVYGAIVPCLHPSVGKLVTFDVCASGGVGAMFSDATNVTRSFPSTNVYASLGPRAGVTIAPWPTVGFRLGGDLEVALARVHLDIQDAGHQREAWVSPAVSFLGSAGVVLRFR